MSDYSTQIQTLVLAVLLATAAVAPASFGADATPPGDGEATFHFEQGGECYEVAAYGDGNASVEDFYDYRRPSNTDPSVYTYSSHGTQHLQDNQVSNVFVYHGTDGYSLVMLHDELWEAPYGSTVTFEISGLPADREWVVEDDAYEDRDDEFYHGATSSTIHWKWANDRTDGAAVRGLGSDDYEAVTIDPGFNEDAARWGDWMYSGDDHRVHEWRLLGADGTVVSLDMDRSVSLARGGCDDGDETTTTTTETTTETTSTTETTQTTQTTDTTQTTTTTETTTGTTQTTTTSQTTRTTTETTSTTETTQTTTETTRTTTTDDDDSNDGGSSGQPLQDQNSGGSQSGSQGLAEEQSSRATADLTDGDGRFGNVTLEADGDATLGVETDGSPPGDVRTPTTERDGFAALSYLDVEADDATATVTLSTDRLGAMAADADGTAVSADEVTLFRFENDSWISVETEQVDPPDGDEASDETVRFRADVTDGVYAVGVERPAIAVADLTVGGENLFVGESVEVVATVENHGLADGTRSVTVSVGEEVVATRNVSVPAGETREVVVAHAFETAGAHAVEVGDERLSVTVEAAETTATETTEDAGSNSGTTLSTTDATTDATTDFAPGVPGFGVGAALAALAGAVLVVLRRA